MPGQVFGFEHGGSRRYAELIGRLFQMESGDAPLPPGFILELDRPEWRILKRERLWSTGRAGVAANVGNLGRLQIINPANSAMISVILGMAIIGKVAAGRVTVSVDGARIGAGLAQNNALDLRVPVSSGPNARVVATQLATSNALPAISGTQIDSFQVGVGADGQSRLSPVVAILAPNTNVEITDETANEAANFVAWGYERPVVPDELAL